jgi:hypothetical protein
MYPSHQWPPQGPVYDYPSPAPTGRGNKIALIVAVVIVAIVGWVAVIGMAYSLSTSSQSHAPSSAKPTVRVYTESEQTYLRMLHDANGVNEPDSQLVAAGHQVCTDLHQNVQDADIVGEKRMIMQTRGWSDWTAGSVVARAVTNLCPFGSCSTYVCR